MRELADASIGSEFWRCVYCHTTAHWPGSADWPVPSGTVLLPCRTDEGQHTTHVRVPTPREN